MILKPGQIKSLIKKLLERIGCMKMRNLSLLAGIGAPLLLAGSASAGFVGIKVVTKAGGQDAGLFVCNVYAVFDRPDDEFLAVAEKTRC